MEKYENLKGELEKLYNHKIQGVMLRSKARWHEKGEKSTKYFYNLEKRNNVRKQIRKLQLQF